MMLKESSIRNQRSKDLKIKHALQTCLLLVICIWMFHQLKLFLNHKATDKGTTAFQIPEKLQNEHGHWKIGRKSLLRQEHGDTEIEGEGIREENSGIEQEMEDEEPERIEGVLLDEDSKAAFDVDEEQDEAIDSTESSFDVESNE